MTINLARSSHGGHGQFRPTVTDTWIVDDTAEEPEDCGDASGYLDAATLTLRYGSRAMSVNDELAPLQTKVTPRAFRDAIGCLATGVCVLTTVLDGQDAAMTANSLTSVSLDPPLVLVCTAKAGRFHDAILKSGVWGISILDARAPELSSRFARAGRDPRDQLDRVEYVRGTTGVALLCSSVAQLECVTSAVYPGGDHDIIVGAVQALSQTAPGTHPLLFHRGAYRWML